MKSKPHIYYIPFKFFYLNIIRLLFKNKNKAFSTIVWNKSTVLHYKMFANEDNTFFYRIVKHPMELFYPDGKSRSKDDFQFSVMILDKTYNLIKEVVFEGQMFDYRQSFAYKNKLYLNINNPLNDNVDEDHLQFAVYALN